MDVNGKVGGKTPFAGVMPNPASTAFKDASMTTTDLVNALQSGASNLELGDKITALYFDVQVQNAMGAPLFLFSDCSLNTRRASIDVNGIIIMSDVTMLARKKMIATDNNKAQELKF